MATSEPDNSKTELQLATTLPPMLLTVAVFSLSIEASLNNVKGTILDELLSLLAAFCLFSAALLVDFVLDKINIPSTRRFSYLSGGYLMFCLAVSFAIFLVPVLYAYKQQPNGELSFQRSFLWFFGLGLSVFLKMMTLADSQVFTALMVVFGIASLFVLAG